MLIFGSDKSMMTHIEKKVATCFEMKSMVVANQILGIKTEYYANGSTSIDQKSFITSVLQRFHIKVLL